MCRLRFVTCLTSHHIEHKCTRYLTWRRFIRYCMLVNYVKVHFTRYLTSWRHTNFWRHHCDYYGISHTYVPRRRRDLYEERSSCSVFKVLGVVSRCSGTLYLTITHCNILEISLGCKCERSFGKFIFLLFTNIFLLFPQLVLILASCFPSETIFVRGLFPYSHNAMRWGTRYIVNKHYTHSKSIIPTDTLINIMFNSW